MKNDKDNQIKIKKRIIKDLKNKLKNNSNNTSLELIYLKMFIIQKMEKFQVDQIVFIVLEYYP